MKAADRSGARFAVIVGPDELAAGEVTVRALRHHSDTAGDRASDASARDRWSTDQRRARADGSDDTDL